MLVVDHRNGQKAVLLESLSDGLLVVVDVQVDVIRFHQVADQHVAIRDDQRAQGDDAFQLAVGVLDVAEVDGLAVHAHALDVRKGLGDGHGIPQADVLRGHQRAGAVLGVVQELVDKLPLVFGRFLQYSGHDIGRQLFEHVDLVVEVQLPHDVGDLAIGDRLDDVGLVFTGQVGEHVNGYGLGKHSEDDYRLLHAEVF